MCWSAPRVKQMITTLNSGSSSYWTHTHTYTGAMSGRSAGVRLVRVRQGQSTDWVRDRCEREEEKGSEHVKECSFFILKQHLFPCSGHKGRHVHSAKTELQLKDTVSQSQKPNNYHVLLYTCWLNVDIKGLFEEFLCLSLITSVIPAFIS